MLLCVMIDDLGGGGGVLSHLEICGDYCLGSPPPHPPLMMLLLPLPGRPSRPGNQHAVAAVTRTRDSRRVKHALPPLLVV